ncbi:MAG TPA: TonB family protein [Candidatus Angelobacter sp.]|nr:TonB family protein [Candidatus Angelobacter sp.]
MQLTITPALDTPKAPSRGLQFTLEPEPWLRVFARNLGDLFRSAPPPVWVTAKPAEYWPDALVHRPVAWGAARQSFLCHTLALLTVYGLHLIWLNQPQVLPQVARTAVVHYQLSEYLPAVAPHNAKPQPPRRIHAQKADPELAVQEIVVTNENHISTRQTIVQPSPRFLKQDVPLPNLIVSTPVPGAPVAMNHPLQVLPVNVPQIAPPPEPLTQSGLQPLVFPLSQPVVAPPSAQGAARHAMQALPLEGPVVVAPAPETAVHNAHNLQIPAQAPDVAAPSSEIAANRAPAAPLLPLSAPQVAPPASDPAVARNLSNIGLPVPEQAAAPPAQPISTGGSSREKEAGQLLVLNAHPIAPAGPITVPEGNRPGEFAASPEGHVGATAHPEIKAGNSVPAANAPASGASPGNIYVSAPPAKITANAVVAAPAFRPLVPDKTAGQPRDPIDTQVFGTRKHYSMKLSMPNLSSSMGSWTVRFAELNPTGQPGSDVSAPEAITKVDPAYPQDLMQDHVEGVVVLRAIIRSDGRVDEVRVLEGVDERLDENARKALEQWRFRPGTKDGVPIDIEAVVRVPFKVRRNPF